MTYDGVRSRKSARYVILACFGILLFGAGVCHSSEEWKAEFEAVCSKTDSLMEMPESEIASLLERCDKLISGLDAENETARKVNQRRLKNCRDLIQFMLDSKRAAKEPAEQKKD
jgi:hypothetical protein